jgi:hypothetical protein
LELSGEEREALLVKADPEIRRAVERLLLYADTPDSLLDHPAWARAASGEQHAGQFTPGQQIGPYRIDAKIGAGGMGQVYRATDLRLNHIVAVKVTGAEFPARFEREAKAIAAREKGMGKRGGAAVHVNLDDAPEVASKTRDREMIAIDEALDRLAEIDPRKGRSSNFASLAA